MQTPAYAGQLSDKLFTEKRNSPFSPNNAVATELQSDPKETSQLLKDIARVLQSPIPSPAGYMRQLEAQLQAERASGAGAEGHSGGMASGARRMSAPPPVGTRPASAEARRGSAAPALMSPLLISPRKRSAAEATAKQLVASLEHMLADGSSAAGSMALSALHSCSSTLAGELLPQPSLTRQPSLRAAQAGVADAAASRPSAPARQASVRWQVEAPSGASQQEERAPRASVLTPASSSAATQQAGSEQQLARSGSRQDSAGSPRRRSVATSQPAGELAQPQQLFSRQPSSKATPAPWGADVGATGARAMARQPSNRWELAAQRAASQLEASPHASLAPASPAAEALQAIAAELSGVAVDESPPRLPGGAGRRLSVLASPAPSGMVRQQSVSRLPGSPHRLSVAGGAMLDASPVPSPLAAFGLAAPASPRSPRSPMAGRGGGSPRARSSLVVGMALPPIECIVLPEPQLDLTPPEGLRFEAEARELLAALADFGDAERRAAGRHRAEVGARLDELFRWPPPARAVAL